MRTCNVLSGDRRHLFFSPATVSSPTCDTIPSFYGPERALSEEALETVQRHHHVWCHSRAGASVLHNVCRQAASRCARLKNLHPNCSAKGRVRHMPDGSRCGTNIFGGRVPGLRPFFSSRSLGQGPAGPLAPRKHMPPRRLCRRQAPVLSPPRPPPVGNGQTLHEPFN